MKPIKELAVVWTMVMLSLSAAAESLTFTGAVSWFLGEAGNWKTASGVTKAPEEDDDLYLDKWVGDMLSATSLAYVRSMTFNEWFYCYGINYSGFCLKSGGTGLSFNGRKDSITPPLTAWSSLWLDGEVMTDIKLDLYFTKGVNGRSATQPGRLIKTGPATLTIEKAGDFWTGATIREGTFAMNSMNGKSGVSISFDGTAESAYFQLGGDLDFKDGALRSTADLPVTNHGVTDDGSGKTLILSGNVQDEATVFGGGLHGAASFAFAPTDATKTFTFVRAQSTSTGAIKVNNGTVVLSEGASFPALTGLVVDGNSSKLVIDSSADQNLSAATLSLANGGSVELQNAFVHVAGVTINGTPVEPGAYGTKAGDNCTKADWIGGSGYVLVGVSEEPTAAATWNGTGAVSSSANWQGGQPDLHTGKTLVTVAGGSAMTADVDVWFKGITLGAADFSISTAPEKEIWLGAQGLSNPNGVNLDLEGNVLAVAKQDWNIGDGQLALVGYVRASGGPLTVITKNDVAIGGDLSVNANVNMASAAKFTVAGGATVSFGGEVFASGSGSYLRSSLGDGSRMVCNGPFVATNCAEVLGNGTLVLNDRLWVYDRLYIQALTGENHSPTIEFHAKGNRLNRFIGRQNTGTLKTMVEEAFSSDNNVQLSPKDRFVLDLCGNDQSVVQLGMHATGSNLGGTVTSEDAAVLHLRPKEYWPGHCYNQSFDRSSPDAYGYETADKGHWEGGVTLSYEAANGLTRSIMRTSSTTGNIEVVSGTLVFLRRAKTSGETFDLKGGSSNPYERLADEDGAWPNASKVAVRGGVLKLEHGKAFGKEVAVELNSDGKLDLDVGVNQHCASLKINGVDVESGVYGSSTSGAQYVDDSVFTGQGRLTVGRLGLVIVVE